MQRLISVCLLLLVLTTDSQAKSKINILADATLNRFKQAVTGGAAFLSQAAAVLVFPQVLKAGVDGSVAVIKWGVGEDINTLDIKDPLVGFVFCNKGLMFTSPWKVPNSLKSNVGVHSVKAVFKDHIENKRRQAEHHSTVQHIGTFGTILQ